MKSGSVRASLECASSLNSTRMLSAADHHDSNADTVTRRVCVTVGALLFSWCVFVATVASSLPVSMRPEIPSRYTWSLFEVLYVAIPLATLMGAFVGYFTYYRALNLKPLRNWGCFGWFICLLLIQGLTLVVFMHHILRQNVFDHKQKPTLGITAVYLALLTLLAATNATQVTPYGPSIARVHAYMLGGIGGLILGDTLLIYLIAKWRGMLAPPPTSPFQFSLSGLMLLMLAVGGYASGLVLIFGKK
jgi:hypothetical protein